MRLSTKSRYGLRAIFDIAYHADGSSAQVQDIARRQELSPRYIEQIFQKLKKAGILRSKRGPQGGYSLARPMDQITVKDVVIATEGDMLLVDCSPRNRRRRGKGCMFDGSCITQTVWNEASQRLEELFQSITLAELCRRGYEAGLPKDPARNG
ncbi:MAG: Rrf2 family transcriptional regulator [Desulfuromonadia bacterium]